MLNKMSTIYSFYVVYFKGQSWILKWVKYIVKFEGLYIGEDGSCLVKVQENMMIQNDHHIISCFMYFKITHLLVNYVKKYTWY